MLKFSVAMCVYGRDNPEWFRTAVDSILNQTRKPDEVVLVVDGLVPEQMNTVIKEYEVDSLFQVVRLPQNSGHGEARRISLMHCTYDLVALMDADDISVFNRFEKQLELFRKFPELSAVGGNITEFEIVPENKVGARIVYRNDLEIKDDMKKRCPMNQVTVMFRKSIVEQAGGYRDWFSNEDYYLWIRMMQMGAVFSNIPECLVNVRVGEEMYRRRGGWKYFASEVKLQRYMLDNRIIGYELFVINVVKRLIVQVFLPNRMRRWVFKKFARKKVMEI